MAANPARLMTVADFRALPTLPNEEEFQYELHGGELVRVTRPKMKHHRIQRRLRQLLEAYVGDAFVVETEVAFRALPEYDLRVADVAAVAMERWASVDPEDNLRGAPDLVIEVLSPSNTVREMYDREQLCLENGAREFWVVDPERKSVRVASAAGPAVTYRGEQRIPISLAVESTLAASDIFS